MNHTPRSLRAALAAAFLGATLLAGCGRPPSAPAPQALAPARHAEARHADFAGEPHSADAGRVADWVVASADARGQSFAVIDKLAARLYVFGADGRLVGAAPVLLGAATGDNTFPGVGDKPLSALRPEERTTPAGRFAAEHGTNLRREHVIWIDYGAAVSMHPVLTTNPAEHRIERLASPDAQQHRISSGCVNVPTRFFETVVLPTLAQPHPVIYVLPEVRPLDRVFPGAAAATRTARLEALPSLARPGGTF
jgi:hypothetical protein